MRTSPIRVHGYCRVSSFEQERSGTSLGDQQAEIERHCAANGWPTPMMHVETESGARAEARDVQLRLMVSLRPGDVVLVSKQDRWSRDTMHFLASADAIVVSGARFLSLAEHFDPATPEGRFASTIMAAVAEQELRRIRDRTYAGRQSLRAAGLWAEGKTPYGYHAVERRLVPVPAQAAAVERTFSLYLDGGSVRTVADRIAEEMPLEAPCYSAVAFRLRDRTYVGETPARTTPDRRRRRLCDAIEWRKTHTGIIDPLDFEAAQRRLTEMKMGGRRPGRDALSANFVLRGLGECALCGHRIEAHAASPSGTIRHGGWYQCAYHPCVGIGSLRHDRVDEQMSDLVVAQIETLIDALANPKSIPVPDAPDWGALRARVETKRARLVTAIGEGVVTSVDARAQMAVYASELSALAARELASAPRVIAPSLLAGALSDATRIRRMWRHVPAPHRREVVGILAKGVTMGREAEAVRAVLAPRWRTIGEPSAASSRCGQILDLPMGSLAGALGFKAVS